MSGGSPPPDENAQQTSRRLKLVLKTPGTTSNAGVSAPPNDSTAKEESGSPHRPSYSPVTPTLSHTSLVGHDSSELQWNDNPRGLPVSLDDNADAIALKATISLLQMQRQQSLKDIRALDKMKKAAMDDPEAFAEELKSGKLKKPTSGTISLDDAEDSDSDTRLSSDEVSSRFGKLPNAQNIARCPPVEWAKYHVVGQPLDTMHDLQQRYPGTSEYDRVQDSQIKSREILAPYRPFTDRLDPPKSGEGYET